MANSTERLMSFCQGFLGYGNPKAPLWFIAMEEGGGNTEDEVVARISAWERRGRPLIDDLRQFCSETYHEDVTLYGTAHAPRSPTWHALIGDKWTREGKPAFKPVDIDRYQQTEWLSSDGDACLVNLLPLPSPGTSVWLYENWPCFPWRNRAAYKNALVDSRIKLIQNALAIGRPSQLVFASQSREYRKYWHRIAVGFNPTAATVIPHPGARRFTKRNPLDGTAPRMLREVRSNRAGPERARPECSAPSPTPSGKEPAGRPGLGDETEIVVPTRRGAASGEVHAAMSATVARSEQTLAAVSSVPLARVIEHCRFCAKPQPQRGWHRPIYIWQVTGWVLAPNVRIEFR